MPLDGLTLSFLSNELRDALVGGRIDRIVQPERDELNLAIRNNGQNYLLLLSAGADCARAHLTAQKKIGPLEAPALCMLMRKHVTGGRISDIRQIDCDRILEISIDHYDELGERATKKLICEFMGKHSNLIFLGGDGRIIDSARRVNEAMSSVREVLPGLRYELPPAHGKIPFAEVSAERLLNTLQGQTGFLWKLLARSISGLSTQAAHEFAFRATGNEDAHIEECDLRAVCESAAFELQHLTPNPQVLFDSEGKSADFTAFEYRSRGNMNRKAFETLSEAMDAFYLSRDQAARIQQKSATMHRVLKTNIERLERKLALQKEALLGSERMEEYRIKGELLMANLNCAKKGEKSVQLPNYYEEEMPLIQVELDEKLSPSANAQRYFKLYQKARNAKSLAAEQIEITSAELDYLDGQMDNLGKCSEEAALVEMREELEKLGYIKPNRNRRQMKQLPPSKPMRFALPNGRIILVGRNNLQNDKLTFTAQPDEIWLHAKDMPGSHAIIIGENPDDETIRAAAQIAAAYSKGAQSSNVPVDYTLRKYVKKPSGARPGFVIFTHQKTLYVHPDPHSGCMEQ